MEFDEIADSKFCKSNKNIILFYEGRKEFISVEEVELIENILIQHGISQSVEENKNENKLKLFTPTIFAICLNGVNVFLRRFEGSETPVRTYGVRFPEAEGIEDENDADEVEAAIGRLEKGFEL